MASVVSKVLTILWLILCYLSATTLVLDPCAFKDGKIFSVPKECYIMSEDFYKEKWQTLSQFPMKIVSDGLEMSEVTRIQGRNNDTRFYFGIARKDDISDTELQLQLYYPLERYKICRSITYVNLKDLLSHDIRHLSNCGTNIIFKNTELGNDVEYLNICQCIQPLSISSSKLREIMMPDLICREAGHDYSTEREKFCCKISGKCININFLCDGLENCEDGSDETNCTDSDYCSERGDFRCQSSGKCVNNRYLCNGYINCEDGSDERNCTDRDYCSERGEFRCQSNGKCVNNRYLCNGYINCEDGSDERNCTDGDLCTERGYFRCQTNGKCVDNEYLCDGDNNCEDGSDERNCTERDYCTGLKLLDCYEIGDCEISHYKCIEKHSSEYRSDYRKFNDTIFTDMGVCNSKGMYRCEETGVCVSYGLLCDDEDNCGDRSDEKYCNAWNTCELRQQARCGNGQCIPHSYLCDNKFFCSDGSDEYNCTEMSVHAPNLKKVNTGFKTLMMISYSEATEKSVEDLEIHNSKIFIEFVIVKIKNFHELKHLDFSNSEVLSAPLIIVTGILIQSVKILNLTRCEINNLDIIPLNVFPNLKVLDLHHNKIKTIKWDTFLYVQNIMKLNMSMSFDIESVILYFNTSSNKMDFLDLSNNRLNELEVHLSGEVNVTDLSNNRLKYSTVKIISDVKSSINYLDLNGNKIKLSGQLFENLKCVNTVDIQDYRLDCADCDILQKPSLQNALRNKIDTRVIYNNMDNIPRCSSPDIYTGEMFDNVNICDQISNWVVILIAAAVIIVLLILVMSGVGYKYRFEISYWIQYVKLKKRKLASCYCDADGYEYDAFISYCAADRRWVWTVLRPGLEESLEKYHLCLHERDFLLGSRITENIVNSMQVSRYCIMILSNYFIESQWCRFEIELAGYKLIEEKREFLIIIELEPLDMTNVPPHLKQLIETRTYLEWNLEKFTEESLVDRLKRALGTSIFKKNMQSQEDLDYVDTTL